MCYNYFEVIYHYFHLFSGIKMNYKFICEDKLKEAIDLVVADLGITVVDDGADVTVTAKEVKTNILTVEYKNGEAAILYGGGASRFLRGLATLNSWVESGITEKSITETPHFTANGAMIDVSRGAVLTVGAVKLMLRKMALMGLNTFMLYTEDTYEIEGRPYFGYMRGRYTKDEIREIDAYALTLGIELIPCIQVLGHLDKMLRWNCTAPYRDTSSVMLVGTDATYELIGEMLDTVSECFTTRRIHIGMDETHDLGTGSSLDVFGYRERAELFMEHLNRVAEMVRERGLTAMMWSDMFFRLAGKDIADFNEYDARVKIPENFRELVPQGVQQVFWNYDHNDEEFFDINLKNHFNFCDKVAIAGSIWTESGVTVNAYRALGNARAITTSAIKNGVREVFMTAWNNSGEGCLMLALLGLSWYADTDYRGYFDEDGARETFKNAMGLNYDDFYALDNIEHIGGTKFAMSKVLFWNDPLIGLIDKHIEHIDAGKFYREKSECYAALPADQGEFTPVFDVVKALTSLLENKADFGVRLKRAYDANDHDTLAAMRDECDVVIEKIQAYADVQYKMWFTYHKPFGWEVLDLRYGGLVNRFTTAKNRIEAYLVGEIDKIGELHEERMRFDCRTDDYRILAPRFMLQGYAATVSANRIQ